ncbi:SCO family protein [Paenibacillus thalictri]|uniref:SCO family protein n=1 Tax=Paenibacillus thalictri TaxID=2527873 RepID=A0A4Q9DEF6_9BACL|nr:SCO family protein [Paenibacillus thalictri]TBL69918.1 SCO family protein [Paenibacillus thalictri]
MILIKRYGFRITVVILLAMIGISVYSWSTRQGPPLPTIKQAPDFSLLDLKGTPVRLSHTDGKVRLVEFLFTSCPDICPMTTYNMVKLQDKLKAQGLWGNKVQFFSITFDPLKDTPEVFKSYGDRMGIDYSGWNLLTGTEKETGDTARDFGVLVQKMQDGSFVHTVTSLFLVDQTGKIRKVFPMGEDMDNETILKMIWQLTGS